MTLDGTRRAITDGKIVGLNEGKSFKTEGPIELASLCTALALSPDGQMLATAELNGAKGRVFLWNPKSRNSLDRKALDFETPVGSLGFSLDSERMVTTNGNMNGYSIADGDDKMIRVWRAKDASSSKPERELSGHPRAVSSAAFFADGKRLFSASWFDGTLRVWHLDKAEEARVIKVSEPILGPGANVNDPKNLTCFTFWPWGRALTGHKYGGLKLWNLETGELLDQFPQPTNQTGPPVAVAISPDGCHALAAFTDFTLYLYRLPAP